MVLVIFPGFVVVLSINPFSINSAIFEGGGLSPTASRYRIAFPVG
jgi:hypothetical protein